MTKCEATGKVHASLPPSPPEQMTCLTLGQGDDIETRTERIRLSHANSDSKGKIQLRHEVECLLAHIALLRSPFVQAGIGQPEGYELPALPKHAGAIDTYHPDGSVTAEWGYTADQMLTFRAEGIAADRDARQAPAEAPKESVNSDFAAARMFLAAFPESFFESDLPVDRTTFAHAVDHLDDAIKLVDRLDGYARSLAMHLWGEHYIKDAPQFELLDDAYGVLSQIDNMLTGLARQSPDGGMDVERLDFVLDRQAFISTIPASQALHGSECYQLMEQDEDEDYQVISGEGIAYKSKREAIDAAMEAQEKGPAQ